MASYRDRIYQDYASAFQDLAPEFDAVAARRWGKAYDYYLRNWLPADKEAAIVDLACGGGQLLYFFKERGFRNVSGVDISPSQVAISKQVVPDIKLSNVLDFLTVNVGKFDLITGLDISEHFTKDEFLRFLDGCHNALKPGGRLILQTINSDTPWAANMRYYDFTHEIAFTINSISRLLRLCGFVQPEPREVGPPLGYSLLATIRFVLWQFIRLKLVIWNYIELGQPGDGVFTRNLFISATRK